MKFDIKIVKSGNIFYFYIKPYRTYAKYCYSNLTEFEKTFVDSHEKRFFQRMISRFYPNQKKH